MILQRDRELQIWGQGPEGVEVVAEIQGKTGRTEVKESRWFLTIPPLTASMDETLSLRCGEDIIVLENICVGEVWLAGGQSNMEFFIRYDENRDKVLKDGCDPFIRFFDQPEISYAGQELDADYSKYGLWRTADRESLEYFSAAGYYFAARLREELNVPVGIVGCNWGGTQACNWMDPKYLEGNEGRIWLDEYKSSVEGLDEEKWIAGFKADPGNYRNDLFADKRSERLSFGMSDSEMEEFMAAPDYAEPVPNPGPLDPKRPGGLFDTMLLPLSPFKVRGFLWYQGESDNSHADIYDTVLSSLIRCWRDVWGEELPFLLVQLAPFRKWLHCDGGDYPLLRDQQERVASTVPRVWMASIMDSGMEKDIHPKRKKPVGERLALLALGKVYGREILCESPAFREAVLDGEGIVLSFDNARGGLILQGERLSAVDVCLDGRRVEDPEIKISGESVKIGLPELKRDSTVSVDFAWKDYCVVNLYNQAGLPARPFRCSLPD